MESNQVKASLLAARFAQAMGLKPGNLWEPPIARMMAFQLDRGQSYEWVVRNWEYQTGIKLA